MLELFSVETSNEVEGEVQQVHAISRPALDGGVSPKAFQLLATMQDQEVLILVDSGSSTSFINQRLAERLSGARALHQPCRVKVADGGELVCSASIPDCQWSSQGLEFVTDMKILPLGVYDAILGMDWLEQHSPMTVDWRNKHLRIPTALGPASLFGHEAQSTQCHVINSAQLQQLHRHGALLHLCLLYPIDEKPKHSVPEAPGLQRLLAEFEDVFGEPQGLPPRRACDHKIPLMPGAQPVNIRPYRHKPEHKSEIERQVQELLQSGVIQRSHNTFSSPVILVKKKDDTWRMCVDYRHLNAMTHVSKFPVPIIEELLDELHGAVWFSKLDLRAGYHQIRLAEGEEFKTAFQTHSDHYEFKVLSFGLAGGPGTFNGAITETMHPLLRHYVLLFFDDILVFSKTWEDHLAHLRQVLELLRRDQWKVKESKCEFGQRQLSYLGHVISSEGVATDPGKIQAVEAWPTPTDAKEVRRFLGLAGYYRRFVRGFGIIARPMFNLLKKGVPFVWTENTDQAFTLLKQQLVSAPVLAMPDFSKPFTIETDACDKGIGAVLQQEGHPIAFMSKGLSPRPGLSTYEKEYLAIVVAVDQWRPYLQHSEFVIFIDQKSLIHLEEQRLTMPWQ
uniref:Reverse transcriptase domain-containing protein n=1 Tax=Triticum urartu TaxID=4572 RepID=A0A8R7VA35_TRIUA